MRFREGDYLETTEGLFFHVKGVFHPSDRIIAFLRYVPDDRGNREKDGDTYRKIYPLKERFDYLEDKYPEYVFHSDKLGKKMQGVPLKNIERVFRPEEKFRELREQSKMDPTERQALELTEKIAKKSFINRKKIGITGSVLIGLHKKGSDIDLISYGEKEGRKVYKALKELKKHSREVSSYKGKSATQIAEFRWGKTGQSIEKTAKIESRKVLHGLFKDKDFFMRLVKDKEDFEGCYENRNVTPLERAKVKGIILDDSDSIYTPNEYILQESKFANDRPFRIEKIKSFRGRFAEQAKEGDRIEAVGTIEKVIEKEKESHRLLLGQTRDYMIPERTPTSSH